MPYVDDRRAEDARLVAASRAGDPSAFAALFDRWFDRCTDVAWRVLHDRDAAADVAQEAFLAAWQGLGRLRDPASFGGWVLRTARNRALDRLDRERRAVVVGDDRLALAVDGSPPTDEVAAVVTRAEDADLVWAASAALGERDASILDLHLRHELAAPEIAEALGVTPNNAHQLLFRLRKRLSGAIRAWVLWREGEPACTRLAGALAAAGVARFGPDAVRVVAGHVPDCADCDSRQHLRLAPEALFAAVPIAPVAPDVRARAEAALRAEGVPAGPSGRRHGRDRPSDHHRPLGRRPRGPHPRPGRHARALTLAGTLVVVAASVATVAAARPQPALRAVGEATGPAGDLPPGTTPPTTTGDPAPATTTTATSAPGTGAEPASASPTAGPTAAAAPASDGPPEGGAPTTTVSPAGPDATSTTVTTTTSTTTGGGEADLTTGSETPEAPVTPEVLLFTATGESSPAPCVPGQRRVTLAWESTGATSATLSGPGVPGGEQAASGTATACVTGSAIATFALTTTGPGGTDSATATG